jgi:nucleotidyltransferase/DNA polymerase involved in DNA repair
MQVLGDLPVEALRGVGWALKGRLAELGITQCRQVRRWQAAALVLRVCHVYVGCWGGH